MAKLLKKLLKCFFNIMKLMFHFILLQNYVRPLFVDDEEPSQIEILAGRHPVSEVIFCL